MSMMFQRYRQALPRCISNLISFVLGLSLAIFICGLVIERLRISRDVFKSVVAGATRESIEATYGPPRFRSTVGQPLRAVGWNGAGKDLTSERGMNVYQASWFEFIVCEFDESGRLERVLISTK